MGIMAWLQIWVVLNAVFLVWRVWVTSTATKTRNQVDDGLWVTLGHSEILEDRTSTAICPAPQALPSRAEASGRFRAR